MSAVVTIIGSGQLADFVSDELSPRYETIRRTDGQTAILEETDMVLLLHDTWRPALHRETGKALQRLGVPWLRGFVAFGEGVIGPLVRPGRPGCSLCADTRRHMAGRDRREMWELQQKWEKDEGRTGIDAWSSRTGLRQMALILADAVHNVLQGGQSRWEERIYLIHLKTLRSSSHFFLPDPLCPLCSQPPDDSEEGARVSLLPRPKPHPDSYRCRSLNELKDRLRNDYLDHRSGFLNGTMRDLVSPFADASVNLPLFADNEGCAGRTHSYEISELTAILEGLERYCGMTPRGKRTVVRGSFRQLEGQALDPVKVGLYSEEQYKRPGFPMRPFDPDQPLDWVWGYSFMQERPLLVPESLAYYSSGCGERFVHETSNGCALGGSLEEAVLYGLLEVVERDSFLMTWYARLPLPRLDPYSAGDPELSLMIDRLQAVTDYDVYLYNSTMEHGIPSVWAIAKNRTGKGGNLVCAAGAHPDPVRAMKGSIHELAGMLLTLGDKFEENRERYIPMLQDPFLVRDMEDHSMLYSLPEAEPRLHFLLDNRETPRTVKEEFKPVPRHADLTQDLREILDNFRRLKLEVIVVDQTAPELARNGLSCVKVLVPGMLPMTFGHSLARLTGLDRLWRVPVQLGHAEQPLTPEQLNPYPHPFP